MRGSKFGKQDDVMLDREIKKLKRQVEELNVKLSKLLSQPQMKNDEHKIIENELKK